MAIIKDITQEEYQEATRSTKVEVGSCPKCGCHDLNYGEMEFVDGNAVYYEADCNDCGAVLHEWYTLEFDGCDVMADDTSGEVKYTKPGEKLLNDRSEEDEDGTFNQEMKDSEQNNMDRREE